MRPSDDKQVFFDMQEHPENYSDEQLETMMTELDREPDAEEAWLLLSKKLKAKSEKRKAKSEKRKAESEMRIIVVSVLAF